MRLVLGFCNAVTLEELATDAVGTTAKAIRNKIFRGQTINQVMGPYSQRRKMSQMTVVRSMYSVVSRYQVSDFWLLSNVVTRLLLLLRRELKSVYFSPRSARAAVDCSSVSCANLERESSLCINCCVRRRAAVTSEAALVMTSFSVRCELFTFLRRCVEGVEEPECRPEKRSSRSLSLARSALRLAVS